MSNYIKTTNFAAKDSLPSGNAAKIVKGAEIDTEFNNIATASATKANANNAALTGTTVFATLSDGTIAITGWVDEDNMASNSAVLIPTQQSVKAYVDSNVTAQDLDVTDGTTSIDIDLDSESLGILGGTGVTSTASGTGVTLAIDSTVATLTGTQTLSNKTLTTPVISGALTTNSTIDGRDVAVDGTKLDGIESGATADQTAAEIKTAYESNANTNAFTDSDESKLDGIEASADVTDTTNVTAAGALMDSELTNITAVKALNQGVATGDSPTFAAVNAPLTGNVTGNLTGNVTGNVTGDLTGDVTGNVTGNVAGNLTGSVLTAAQTNITSVGNLTSLQVIDGDFNVLASEGAGAAESLLIADVSTKRVGVNKASPSVSLDIGSNTDAVHMPTGTTAQRPTGSAGYFRYNSTLEQFEGYTDAWGAIGGGGGSNLVSDTMTGDGVDTTLTLSNDPLNENNTQVYIDGVYQNKDTYSVSGTTLTFSTAPPNGSAVEAMTIQPTAINIPADGSVTSAKLSGDLTTPSALTVTGTVTADGLTVANTSVIAGDFDGGTAATYIRLQDDTDNFLFGSNNSLGNFLIKNETADALRLSVANTGDISFYNSAGTSQSFFWDASAESLGIGTSSPTVGKLQVNDGSGAIVAITRTSGATSGNLGVIRFGNTDIDSNLANITAIQGGSTTSSALTFETQSTGGATAERMRILPTGGITFNGDTAQANALDDYEEGAWIPTDASGASLSLTVNSASYIKIGRSCYISAYITYPTNSSIAAQQLGGLPFTTRSSSTYAQLSMRVVNAAFATNNMTFQTQTASNYGMIHFATTVPANSDLSGISFLISGVYETV